MPKNIFNCFANCLQLNWEGQVYSMKIYTVTFCNTTNVGAALQEYALQKYLQINGHDAKVLNYIPKIMMQRNSVWIGVLQGNTIYERLKGIILLPLNVNRKLKYYKFSKKFISLTRTCRTITDIEKLEQPDMYLAGSDQIWNDELTNWNEGYFLNFKTSARKVAYAASAGKDIFSDLFLHNLKIRAEKFDSLSVREALLQKSLLQMDIKNVKQVLDPVFLLSKEHYESILIQPKLNNYILLYEAELNEKCILVARELAHKHNKKIVQINRINNKYKVDKLYPCVSPTEFLGLVKYADYVVTNSFHAVAFSLILEKEFWVIKLKNLSSRIDSILKLTDLENRIIGYPNMQLNNTIDYKLVNSKLKLQRDESINFLQSTINEEGIYGT